MECKKMDSFRFFFWKSRVNQHSLKIPLKKKHHPPNVILMMNMEVVRSCKSEGDPKTASAKSVRLWGDGWWFSLSPPRERRALYCYQSWVISRRGARPPAHTTNDLFEVFLFLILRCVRHFIPLHIHRLYPCLSFPTGSRRVPRTEKN